MDSAILSQFDLPFSSLKINLEKEKIRNNYLSKLEKNKINNFLKSKKETATNYLLVTTKDQIKWKKKGLTIENVLYYAIIFSSQKSHYWLKLHGYHMFFNM